MHNPEQDAQLAKEEKVVSDLLLHNEQQAADRLRLDADTFPQFNKLAENLFYKETPKEGSTVYLAPIYQPPKGISLGREVVVWDQHRYSERVAIIDPYQHHHSVKRR